ncbi:hypothetical protein MPER_04537, partial [Moniliophthora perniciosa FA553]
MNQDSILGNPTKSPPPFQRPRPTPEFLKILRKTFHPKHRRRFELGIFPGRLRLPPCDSSVACARFRLARKQRTTLKKLQDEL